MSLPVFFNGAELAGTSLAGGQARYVPDFLFAIGMDAAALVAATAADIFIDPRDHAAMHRGRALPRIKCYVNATGDPDLYALYRFPGFQYAAMLHYRRLSDEPVAFLQPLFDTLRTKLTFGGEKHAFNQVRTGDHRRRPPTPFDRPRLQAIITSYPTGDYNIGWRSDKMTSIAPDSIIFDVSLGAERTFLLRNKATGAEESIRMASGSAIALTTAGNELFEHAVLREPGAGPRVSVVFRNIATMMSRDEMMKRIAVSMKAKAKAKAKAEAKVKAKAKAKAKATAKATAKAKVEEKRKRKLLE
jgi:hypothetical protein